MVYFNQISNVFLRNIYERPKGAIRLAILKRDLEALLNARPLRILDIGAGAGQMGLWYASLGHQVTLIDEAENLLKNAENEAKKALLADKMQFIYGNVFGEKTHLEALPPFDLITCHAVLEWVENQRDLLQLCWDLLQTGGHLSLMFYNRSALEFAQNVFGNFSYLDRDFAPRRKTAKLTPDYPCDPEKISEILQNLGFSSQKRSNIRCFYDYMKPADRERHTLNELVARELALADDERFTAVARYLHQLVRKT